MLHVSNRYELVGNFRYRFSVDRKWVDPGIGEGSRDLDAVKGRDGEKGRDAERVAPSEVRRRVCSENPPLNWMFYSDDQTLQQRFCNKSKTILYNSDYNSSIAVSNT